MNNVTMSGNLTRDPELIYRKERAVCRMRLAVDNGAYPATFVDLCTFGGQAEACAEHLGKGRKVGVVGRLAHEQWVDEEGRKRESYSVIGKVEFLDRPPQDPIKPPGEDAGSGPVEQPELLAA